jgi:ribosomal protein S18 acetylase RimI-like enzyme
MCNARIMDVRHIRTEEFGELGAVTIRAYESIFAPMPLGGYAEELSDVSMRAADSEVLVAVDDEGSLLGGVTYVPGADRALAEFDDPFAAGIRMLAVDPTRQGEGVGRALMEACIARAVKASRSRIILHSTPEMTRAHALYASLGFLRAPDLDVLIDEEPYDEASPLLLMAFTLAIT